MRKNNKLLIIFSVLAFSCTPKMKVVYVPPELLNSRGVYDFETQTAYIANNLDWRDEERVIEHERDHHLFGLCGEKVKMSNMARLRDCK